MRILLISPNPQTESGGIAQWTGHLLRYYQNCDNPKIQLIHCCYKKSVSTFGSDSIFTRLYKAIHNYIPICRIMRDHLRNNNIDIVHICSSGSLSFFINLYMIKISHYYRAKVVMHYRFGRIPHLLNEVNWESKLLVKVFNNADCNIVIDQSTYGALIERGYTKCVLLPNPLSPDVARIAETVKVNRSPNKIVFVGHVIPTKGVFELVKACMQIKDIQLEMIGYVSEKIKDELYDITGSGGDWLSIVGIKDINYIINAMKSAGVFVLPTYSEGFPNVILESMACACPIVTTPVGAIPEMLDIKGSNPSGICVEPREVEPLVEAISFFINNRNIASQYGERALYRVHQMYSMKKIWEQMCGIWENIAS